MENTETADETAETSKRLTWEDVANKHGLADGLPVEYAAESFGIYGWEFLAWQGNVYRVALEGVAGAIDPPELLGTVGEILGDGNAD